jgi:integrase
MKLTKATVEKLAPPKPGAPAKFEWDDELQGFGVRVTSGGARSYIAQRRVRGRSRRVTLGRHGVITAEQARKKAASALGRMVDGIDPTAQRRREKAVSVTLREVTDRYIATRKTKHGYALKDRTKRDIEYHLAHAFKEWADRPVADLKRDMVSRLHQKLSATAPKQADQAFRVLRALINFAREEYRMPDDSPIIADNPVSVLKRKWHSTDGREGHVPLERIGAWWSTLQARREDPGLTRAAKVGADVVAFLALTGLRWGEASTLKWTDVDLKDGSMRLADPKNRMPVILPLSSTAVSILEERHAMRPKDCEYVFPGRAAEHVNDCRPTLRAVRDTMAEKAKKADQDVEPIEISAHDLRRTFIKIADAMHIERWRTKLLVNHSLRSSGDVTLQSYTVKSDRRDFRPEAERIDAYLEAQRRIAEADNVTPLRKSA